MINSVFDKFLTIILIWFVESDYMRHSKMTKYFKVIFWCISMLGFPCHLLGIIDWTHKCDELPWNNPVEITIFNLLIVFVLSWIEVLKAIPAKLIRNLQTF